MLCAMHGWAVGAWSQAQCTLRVTDNEIAVPGATVWLDGRPVGATNASGEYTWSEGEGRIRIQAIGYDGVEVNGRSGCEAGIQLISLTPTTFALGGATVVGSMSPARLKESPIRTAVLSGASLNAVHAQDLVESLDFTTGVRETVGCGVCGTNSVQLNGMEGVYSCLLYTSPSPRDS